MTQLLRRDIAGLPSEVTSFVGRLQATAEVKRVLSASRLVTLVGLGGVGKSRLALHVAGESRRVFPDGVCLVELAQVQDPALVVSTVAVALGLRDQSVRDSETVLVDYLVDKRMLILLDNCEHVLDASGRLAHTLLSAAPELRVLATSREPLGIAAECVYPVPPLSVPSLDGRGPDGLSRDRLSRFEAVALFEDRAAAAVPGFKLNPENAEAVIRLCQRLDGVPLALELAAVRVRVLSVEQILDRLEQRFELLTAGNRSALPRHQTLRAAVDWSYDLCTGAERLLWARCSVFAGDFGLDAAETVCAGEGLTVDQVLTAIAGLLDKSVLVRDDQGPLVRYRMLETIRQYGADRLAESGEQADMRRRHRDFYLRVAEEADADSGGPRQAELVKILQAERANMSAALEYCLNVEGEARTGLRLASALWFYWIGCGLVRDGRSWLERVLAANPEPTADRARALWLSGWIAFLQGDNTASLDLLTKSRDLAEKVGDEVELTYAIQFLGEAEMFAGNLESATPMLEDALARRRRNGDWTAAALLVFGQRAKAALLHGDVDYAVALLDECKAICASLSERWTLSWAEWNLAVIRWETGEHRKAGDGLRESLNAKADLDDQLGIPFCVDLLAWVAMSDGDAYRAAVLFGVAKKMWRLIGRPLCGFENLLEWRTRARTASRDALGEQAYQTAVQQGAALTWHDAIAYALSEEREPATNRASTKRGADSGPVLTRRERQVAGLVAAGKSNREIAAELVISQRTVESHVDHILGKLGFNSRTQIAVWVADRKGS